MLVTHGIVLYESILYTTLWPLESLQLFLSKTVEKLFFYLFHYCFFLSPSDIPIIKRLFLLFFFIKYLTFSLSFLFQLLSQCWLVICLWVHLFWSTSSTILLLWLASMFLSSLISMYGFSHLLKRVLLSWLNFLSIDC